MLVHLPRIDRKAALLAGHEFGPKPSMELDLASLGPDRERVIKALTINQDGSATLPLDINLPTKEGIIEAIDKQEALQLRQKEQEDTRKAEAEAFRRRGEVQWMEGARVAIEKIKTSSPIPAQQPYTIDDIELSYPGFTTDEALWRRSAEWSPDGYRELARRESIDGQYYSPDMAVTIKEFEDRKSTYQKSVWAADLAAREAVMPGMVQEAARIQEERRLAFQAELAERLETGVYTQKTDPYNDNRWGRPWVAKVTGLDGKKLVYKFGDWTGQDGKAGVLRIECRPGEFLAFGQKDHRNPRKVPDKDLRQMQDDGRLVQVDYQTVINFFLEREKEKGAEAKRSRKDNDCAL